MTTSCLRLDPLFLKSNFEGEGKILSEWSTVCNSDLLQPQTTKYRGDVFYLPAVNPRPLTVCFINVCF